MYEVEQREDLEEHDQDSLYQQFSHQEGIENQQRQASAQFQEQRQYLAAFNPNQVNEQSDNEMSHSNEDYERTLTNNYRNGFSKYTNEVAMYSASSNSKKSPIHPQFSDNAHSREFLIQDQSEEPEIKSNNNTRFGEL